MGTPQNNGWSTHRDFNPRSPRHATEVLRTRKTCPSLQSKGNKMVAVRNVIVGVAATVEEAVQMACGMLRVEISKAVK